jgi:hypothetical protein
MPLTPPERASLRQFLQNRFDLSELKNLAFDLGVDYQLFSHERIQDLSRELVEYFDRRDKLGCLVAEALNRRHDEEMAQLLAKLPVCSPSTKVQIIVSEDLVEDISKLLAEIAEKLGLPKEEVVLIGATRGSTRLLLTLPEATADLLIDSEIRSFGDGEYQVVLIVTFDSLGSTSQDVWRYVASERLTVVREDYALTPPIAWKRAMDLLLEKAPSGIHALRRATKSIVGPVAEALTDRPWKQLRQRLLTQASKLPHSKYLDTTLMKETLDELIRLNDQVRMLLETHRVKPGPDSFEALNHRAGALASHLKRIYRLELGDAPELDDLAGETSETA